MTRWVDLSEAFAFIGNSLLTPMNQTDGIAAEPDFWRQFPSFDDAAIEVAIRKCEAWASSFDHPKDAIRTASTEHASLFIGPPHPAAAPWETFYREGSNHVGFGRATFEMRELLRQSDLAFCNSNNQYEDHIGIEFLYLSVLCERSASNAEVAKVAQGFCTDRLLAWLPSLHAAVLEKASGGIADSMLALGAAICNHLAGER